MPHIQADDMTGGFWLQLLARRLPLLKAVPSIFKKCEEAREMTKRIEGEQLYNWSPKVLL